MPEKTIGWYKEQIRKLEEQLKTATGLEAARIHRKISAYKGVIASFEQYAKSKGIPIE
jgi:hypothetical protein